MNKAEKIIRSSLPALIGYFIISRFGAALSLIFHCDLTVAMTVLAVIAGCFAIVAENLWNFTDSLKSKTVILIVISSALVSPVLKLADRYITGGRSDIIAAWGFGCALCIFSIAVFRAASDAVQLFKHDLPTKRELLWIFIPWAVIAVICAVCATQSNAVYTYDYAIYHERAAQYIELLKSDPIALCGRLYTSFGTDYSGLPSLFAMPFMLLFGNSRVVYVIAISLSVLLTCFILFVMAKTAVSKYKASYILTVFEFPLAAFLVLKGFPDMGCVVFGLTVLYIYLLSDRTDNKGGFICGMLLACGFLFRRYFIIFAIGFFAVLLIDCVLKKQFKFLVFCSAGMGTTLMLPFQKLIVSTLFIRNYGDSYSYYKMGAAVNIEYFTKAFGILLIAVFAVGCIILRKNRNIKLCLAGLAVTITAFLLTQSPNKHHMTIFMAWALVIMLYVNDFVISKGKKPAILLTCFAVVQSAVCFAPDINYPIFHNMRIKPDIESTVNIECYRQVADFLVNNLEEDEQAYVLGVSGQFSESKINSVVFSSTWQLKRPNLLTSAIVDSRDKIPQEFFDVKYIVLTDPIQYERGEEYQQVVKVPAQMLLNSQGWAEAFKRLDNAYSLEDGTMVYIYERIRDITLEEKAQLSYLCE